MGLFLITAAQIAPSQICVISNNISGSNAINIYNFDGTYSNTISLLNMANPNFLATDGTNLYVNYISLGTIGKYTISGSIVNPSLISGLNTPLGMAISGTNLFVADVNRIGKYSTTGAIINSNLITNLSNPVGLLVINTNLFVTFNSTGKIGKYTLDGVEIDASLISNLDSPVGLATDGTNLFVANYGSHSNPSNPMGTIGEYSSSGTAIAPVLVNGLGGANFISIIGTNIYIVKNELSVIGQYTTSGATVNASLVTTSGHNFSGIATVPIHNPAPPPAIGITTYSNQPVVIWPASSGNYVLQTTTNLESGNWTTVTNFISVTGAMITNAPSPSFFRLQ